MSEANIAAGRRFEELFQNLPIACVGYDLDGMVVEWNRASERLFRRDAGSLYSVSVYDLLCSDAQRGLLEQLVSEVFHEHSVENFDWRLEDPSGQLRSLHCSTFPIHGIDGHVCGGIIACLDLTAQKTYESQIEDQLLRLNEYSLEIEQSRWELEEANKRLASLAATDGLTGLLNHRAFQETLTKDVKRAEREKSPLSVVLLDVDKFKLYNDSFGHPAGDAVLKQVAEVLLRCSRGSDTVARYGGEEFVAILPATDAEGAKVLADRMRAEIESSQWPYRQVTASFGVATFSCAVDSVAHLVEFADKALYASKAAGRNCVTHWSDIAEAAA